MKQEEGDSLDIPGDEYYQRMLMTLDGPREKKQKNQQIIVESVANKYDKSSPFFYLNSTKALAILEARIDAEKQTAKNIAQSDREEARAKYLAEKIAKNKRPNSNKGVIQAILASKVTGSSIRERMLEEEMLRPYRKDPKNISNLLEHCRNIVIEKNQQIADARLAKIPKIPVDSVPMSLDQRIESARSRREEQEVEFLERIEWQLKEKSEKNALSYSNSKTHEARMKTWLSVVRGFRLLRSVTTVVMEARHLKSQYLAEWEACVRIQRAYRKGRGGLLQDRDREVTSISQRIRASLGENDDRIALFKKRIVSADLIVQFLRDTRTKASLRRMFRFVKYLQRLARSLREIDQGRILLLQLYIEKCMMPLSAHISIVANNRGLDFGNLSNFEMNQLRAQSHLVKNFRIVAGMHTPEFHAHLRRHISKLTDFQRDFIATKTWTDKSEVRRKLLLKLLTDKRRMFLKELQKPTLMTYSIPKLDIDEVQSFILGGPDPLTPKLLEFQAKHQQWYDETHRPKTPFRCKQEDLRTKFVPPHFSLLSWFQSIDLVNFFVEFTTIIREEKRAAVTAAKLAALASIEAENAGKSKYFTLSMTDKSNAPIMNVPSTDFASSLPRDSVGRVFSNDSAEPYSSGFNLRVVPPSTSDALGNHRSVSAHKPSSPIKTRRLSSIAQNSMEYSSTVDNRRNSKQLHHNDHLGSSTTGKVMFAVPPTDRKKSVVLQQSHRKIV